MICPSCSERLIESVKHCTHCGIAMTWRSVQMARVVNNFGWVGRRALAGFFAGGFGWVVAIAVSRVMGLFGSSSATFTQLLDLFPGTSVLSCVIAASLIGSVGGVIERSAYKSILGGFLGLIGGVLGGLAYPYFQNLFRGQLYSYSFSMAASWSLVSAMVGLTSGLLEGTKSKIMVGLLGGLVGGALGGGIGSQMYGAMLMEVHTLEGLSWLVARLLEFTAGGIAGMNMWFFIGAAEKLYIFRRRQLVQTSKKVCDYCNAENKLSAWYCAQCGSALQVAASREQIQVTPYRGLERIANAFQFLSWLSATIGVVITAVVFLSFFIQNFLFALFGSLLVALVIYVLSILFKAAADTIKMGITIAEKLTREQK